MFPHTSPERIKFREIAIDWQPTLLVHLSEKNLYLRYDSNTPTPRMQSSQMKV